MALTLQMAAGNDNLAVWCIRMKSEGTNQCLKGTFDDDTDWTTSGDWVIADGVATYEFDDDAAGDLTYSVAAVSAAPYVLEYEITETNEPDEFAFNLNGGGAGIVAANIALPKTVGQHRLIIQGVATKQTFRFQISGMDAADKLVLDNVKLRKLEETTYLATETLSLDNTWDGEVLEFNNRISDVDAFVDTLSSGIIGGVASYVFTIARYSSNTKFDGFFEEFYPTFDGGNLSSMDCEIGVVWNTAGGGAPTTDTEITWLMRGRIVDYPYEPRKMIITILQSTEIDSRPLPFYEVQRDFDNGVSYFANAPEENYGTIIPIVYGDLSTGGMQIPGFTTDRNYSLGTLSPCILVNASNHIFICTSHKCSTTAGDDANWGATDAVVYQFIPEWECFMAVYNATAANDAYVNNDIRHTQTLNDSFATRLIGFLRARLSAFSRRSDMAIDNSIDRDQTNYTVVDFGEDFAAQIGGTASEAETGTVSDANDSDVKVVFACAGNAAADRDYTIYYYTPYGAGVGAFVNGTFNSTSVVHTVSHSIGQDTTSKKDTEAWTPQELSTLDYVLINATTEGAGNFIHVYDAYIELTNIVVKGIKGNLYGQIGINNYYASREEFWEASRRRKEQHKLLPIPTRTTNFSNTFAFIKGREYGRWIDHIRSADASKNRTMGDVEGDLIDNPAYIIESILRDEIFVERDLVVTSSSGATNAVCDELLSREDDYYNYAEIFNATNLLKRNVTDYDGATNALAITADATPIAANDNIYLTNVQGDYKIDDATFDVVGNTTNGTRKDWVFAKSIYRKELLQDILTNLCFESHCQIFESINPDTGLPQIKLVAIDATSSGDTWIKPAFRKGLPLISTGLTPLSDIRTSFRLFYFYDYGRQEYQKEIFVDKNGFGGTGTLVIADQLLCKKAEATYRLTNPFSYSANWIYDDTTAELMLQKKIEWFTKQRLIVDWTTGLSGDEDYIKYELGDQVKLNYSASIPTGLNNLKWFMITNKRIITVQGAPLIQWRLIEM